jgi:hypothetical protein
MVPPMAMTAAGMTFFFHVGDFSAGGYFAIFPDHAPAAKSSESEKPDKTHHVLRSNPEQFACR